MPSVLLVSPYLPPHVGGVERYVETIAHELVRLDWRVIVATPARHARGVGNLPGSPIEVRYLNSVGRISNTPVGLGWRRSLRQIIAENQIDIVNAHAPVPGLADAAEHATGSAPFVLTYHAGPMRKPQHSVNVGLRLYERLVIKNTVTRSSYLICSSDYVRSFLDSFSHTTPVEVIPPGVNIDQFTYASYVGRERLLFVGSLERATRYKALDTLIEAVALLQRQNILVDLDVVGEGSALPLYRSLCATNGVSERVTFHGAADQQRLSSFYRRACALIVPSRFDSFPTVILEAMASGTPTIATRVGGIPTVIEHRKNGLLIDPDRPDEIAASVRELLENPQLAGTLGAAGRVTVEQRLTSQIQGRHTAEVLERALAERRHRRSDHHLRDRSNQSTKSDTTSSELIETTTHSPRRLVMVAPYFPPHIGGVEQYVQNLGLALSATGRWEVTVITTQSRRLRTKESREEGLLVIRLGAWGRYSYTPFSPLWPWQLRRLLRRIDPHVVNAHTPVPLLSDLAARATGSRPFLLTYHAATLKKETTLTFQLVERAYAQLERMTIRRSSAVLAVSDYVKEALRDRVNGRLVTFANAVPTSSLSNGLPTPNRGQFVFIARLDREHRWKGLDQIIEACVHCPEARLMVAGDGDQRRLYERRVDELGLGERVQFLGTVVGAAKEELIASSSALIAYPTTSNDAFPTVLLEAWAVGVPVIVAEIGALATLVHHGEDGWLVDPSNPLALAAAMQRTIDLPVTAAEAGHNGRLQMSEMTWERQALRFEELVDSLTHQPKQENSFA